MLTRFSNLRYLEVWLGFALLTQLQWLFGNIYEEVLTPNSITASIEALDAYNAFFRYTEPYYYYVPLTHLGCIAICIMATSRSVPLAVKSPLMRAAAFGVMALCATAFIVIHYNLRMFFGSVDYLGASVHRRYMEWAIWNAIRIVFVAFEVVFCIRAYRSLVLLHASHRPARVHGRAQQTSERLQDDEYPG